MDKDSNAFMQGTALSPARHSRWATASFVLASACLLGLFGAKFYGPLVYLFLAFPAAIASGHVARRRISKSAGRLKGAGQAAFGLSIGYFALFLTVFVLAAMVLGRP